MKKLLALITILLLSIGVFVGCGTKEAATSSNTESNKSSNISSIEQIKKNGKIKIGVFTDKPPFGFVDEKGKNDGFDVELARRFVKDLLGDESKIEYVPLEPANRVPYLESNKVDLIMANMTVTDERKEKVDFTNPILKVSIQLATKKGSGVDSVESLKGKKLIVTKGTTADIFFSKLVLEKKLDVELLKFDNVTESFNALKDGRGAAYSNDNLLLFGWVKDNKDFKVLDETFDEPATIAPAVKKGNKELQDWINKELENLGKEKYLHTLYDKYLKNEFGNAVKNPAEVVVEGGILK
ncbi:transporter substrate-binding domain-containing protein [Clostridium cylindrosporum]|uniref:ABC transporter glutamine-binding protein GlnH n=1 Tax=Clostridium cylindrosporum DSM 605 TaxID=1121307 RepID=A0A0J8DCJ6_CLOCY|nr:transporter substrate-binding domain-containing protein [Clostridium cylindrosporum]KMT21983.1 ABC transporter glutamine-binding protein GlnH [Clostridium cylindrosporum DSM 605]